MGDHPSDGDHRGLPNSRHRRHEPLDDCVLLGQHLVEMSLGGLGSDGVDVHREPSGSSDRGLDHGVIPAVPMHQRATSTW
jgi:hypothetical protein